MKSISLYALLFLVAGVSASMPASTYEKARADYHTALSELQTLETTISVVRNQLDHHSGEVKVLRHKSNRSLLQNYRLQNYLQEAQSLSDRLSKLQKKQVDLSKTFSLAQKVFLNELDKEVESKRNLVLAKDNSLNMRQEAAKMLVNFLSERYAALSLRLTQKDQVPTELPKISEDHQELEEQLLAMTDLESKLALQIKDLKSELALTKRQKFLQRELAQLFEEEAFFGEQGFVSLGTAPTKLAAANKSATQTTLTATTKTPEKVDATSTSTTTATTAPIDAPKVELPASSAPALPEVVAKVEPMKDPLPHAGLTPAPATTHTLSAPAALQPKTVATPSSTAREEALRLDLKNDRKQKPVLDYTSLDQQIHELDQQILSIQTILGEVKKSKKDIQTILHQ